ncbi:hypothetical protein PVAND_016249 [Polypedilum vanderplanki]|uniref:Uncharacterized protein n=1 Tax=Polypedilum vanderplanki TaxID=319348 RepID=A0A9J6BFB7_POLVA|nr:hypothetical protein PVAND_016249 [Polypedilum vanderplanki]
MRSYQIKLTLILTYFFIIHTLSSPSSIPSHLTNNNSENLILNCKIHTLNRCNRYCQVCESENLNITNSQTKLIEVTGFSVRNVAFHNNVIRLSINNQLCRFIPADADKFFPHLETLRIWSSGLKRLEQNDIKNFNELRELILPLNEIETLDSNLFEFNLKITKIDLSRNKLKNVGLALFAPVMKKLNHVNFNHNECIDDNLRGNIEIFSEKVRKFCPPTIEMLQNDVVFLVDQNEKLKLIIEAKNALIKENCDFSKFTEIENNNFENSEREGNKFEQHVFRDQE